MNCYNTQVRLSSVRMPRLLTPIATTPVDNPLTSSTVRSTVMSKQHRPSLMRLRVLLSKRRNEISDQAVCSHSHRNVLGPTLAVSTNTMQPPSPHFHVPRSYRILVLAKHLKTTSTKR